MRIKNKQLTSNENGWLENMFQGDFSYKKEIIVQIENAKVKKEYSRFYVFIKFITNTELPPFNIECRVPIEMRVFNKNKAPTQFLLHIIDGYVHELEIFNSDSSEIEKNYTIQKESIKEILLDESIKMK